jgi:hypothetical protein
VLEQINRMANNDRIKQIAENITRSLAQMANFALAVINVMVSGAVFIFDNWAWLLPLIYGVAIALGAYLALLMIFNAQQAISNGLIAFAAMQAKVKAAADMMQAGSTFAATAAQHGFNAALMACPLTWILVIIIAVIAAIYAVVGAINHVTGSTISATGVIAGSVMWLLALIGNLVIGTLNAIIQTIWTLFVEPFLGIIEWILNVTQGGFDSFGGAVANLIGQVISWFLSLGKVVTTIIDAIFGTNWTAGLSSLQDSVLAWGKNDMAITLDRNAPTIDHRFDMTDAFDIGYNWGEGIDDKLSGIADNLGGITDEVIDFSQYGNEPPNIDRVGSVGRIEDDVTITDEDIKMLKDIASRDYQVRLTQLTPHLSATFGDIRETADAGKILEFIEDSVAEALDSSLVVE